MNIFAISDLHVGHPDTAKRLHELPAHPDDWLILAGDIGESSDHLRQVLDIAVPRYERVVWVPGNHELWSTDADGSGPDKYDVLVALCREYGVLCPEDPWPQVEPGLRLVPLFLLYDYSFGPAGLPPDAVVRWARDGGIVCADERRLEPGHFGSRQAWCHARLADAETRLGELDPTERTILVNHWPLRRDLCRLFRIPRFTPWCGTTATEDWHVRYRAEVVVSGHLHMPATDWRNGVRFEEVSYGYPRQVDQSRPFGSHMRTIWPPPAPPGVPDAGPYWRR